MNGKRRTTVAALAVLALAAHSAAAKAEDTLKVGLLATFEGAFTVLGEDSKRGAGNCSGPIGFGYVRVGAGLADLRG